MVTLLWKTADPTFHPVNGHLPLLILSLSLLFHYQEWPVVGLESLDHTFLKIFKLALV